MSRRIAQRQIAFGYGIRYPAFLAPFSGIVGLAVILSALLMLYGRWLFAEMNYPARTVEREVAVKEEAKAVFLAGLRPFAPEAAADWITSPAATMRLFLEPMADLSHG